MAGIVVGVDGSEHSERALDWAAQEASLRHVPLTVINVFPAVTSYWGAVPYTDAELDIEQARHEVQMLADKAVGRLAGPPPAVTVQATYGSPATELISAAHDAELLVVGCRGSGGFARLLLGSVSSQVAHHAPCPVVIVREPS